MRSTSATSRLDSVHGRVKELDWPASYFHASHTRETKYKIPKRTKDPFKHLLRQYSAMEQEKDERMYGSIADVLSRATISKELDARWIEGQKFLLPILTQLELGAGKGAAVCLDSLENPELRSGYLAQVMDEIRHTNQQMYLQRYWAKKWEDPEAFARGLALRDRRLPIFEPTSALTGGLWNEDPFTIAITFQAMAETAYTNVIFTAVTELGALNGDNVTPTVFLSIQSDEARHMANGYAGLAAVMSEPDNLPLLQPEVDGAFLTFSLMLNPFFGMTYDYLVTNRAQSYGEIWDEWVWDDFVNMYFGRMQAFGLNAPATAEAGREHAKMAGHAAAVFHYGAWFLGINRFDPLRPDEYDWFEAHYPGWHDTYGEFWDRYRAAADPASGARPFELLPGGRLPAMCSTCQHACFMPDPFSAEPTFAQDSTGTWHAFCTIYCQIAYEMAPERFSGGSAWYVHYDGWQLSDVLRDMGLIRQDGVTLMGQPHLHRDRLWTIHDIERQDVLVENPVRLYVESLGNSK